MVMYLTLLISKKMPHGNEVKVQATCGFTFYCTSQIEPRTVSASFLSQCQGPVQLNDTIEKQMVDGRFIYSTFFDHKKISE